MFPTNVPSTKNLLPAIDSQRHDPNAALLLMCSEPKRFVLLKSGGLFKEVDLRFPRFQVGRRRPDGPERLPDLRSSAYAFHPRNQSLPVSPMRFRAGRSHKGARRGGGPTRQSTWVRRRSRCRAYRSEPKWESIDFSRLTISWLCWSKWKKYPMESGQSCLFLCRLPTCAMARASV